MPLHYLKIFYNLTSTLFLNKIAILSSSLTDSWRSEMKWKSLSCVRLFATPWTIQALEFSRPEYWSGQPLASPGDLPSPGTEPRSPALQADSLPAELWGKPTKKKVSPNKAREENRSRRIPETQRQNWLKPLKSRPSGFLFIWFNNKLLNT